MSQPTMSPLGEVLSGEGIVWETPEGRRILDDLSFALGPEKTSLVGPNGAGKTTLARVLVGELEPTRGVIRRSGVIGWLPQNVLATRCDATRPHTGPAKISHLLDIAERLEALRAIESGACEDRLFEIVGDAWDIEARAKIQLDRLGLRELELEATAAPLSGGEAMRVALAGCLLKEPDLLVLDEPTNHLDAAARSKLYQVLDEHRGGLLVISHDRALLRRVERTLELSGRGLRSYGGDFDHYREEKRIEQEAARRRVESAEGRLDQQRRAAQVAAERQARRAGSGKISAMRRGRSKLEIQGAKSQAERTSSRLGAVHEQRLAGLHSEVEIARSRLEEETEVRLDLSATAVPAGRTIIEAEGLNISFGGRRLWSKNIDVRLVGPARLTLEGPSGSGKSTLARLLIGELKPHSGSVRLNEQRLAWLDQRAAVLQDGASLLDGMLAANPSLEAQEIYWSLDRFGLGRQAASRRPETLSGGERMRAALACLFGATSPPRLLVLDEPTNNLDLSTVRVLEKALAAYRGALILISHDADFIAAVEVDQRLRLLP